MQSNIPLTEVDALLDKVRGLMSTSGFREDTIADTRLIVIHPEDWEVSLLVPSRNTYLRETRQKIEDILFNHCGVECNCCDYLGKQTTSKAYEWYFRHPKVPKDIYNRLEMEIEQELGNETEFGLPWSSGIKSNSDTAFITIREEFFDAIARGEKKEEYRNLNQYYCDKFFSSGTQKRFLKINRGYKTGKENQMVFEIKGINYVGEDGREIPSQDRYGKLITSVSRMPNNFNPVAYGILLGKRVS